MPRKAKLTQVEQTKKAALDIKYWVESGNSKKLERINSLIASAMADPYSGIGVPEQLRFHDQQTFSRRIDKVHRLVYRINGSTLVIISARFHYEK